MTKAFHDPVAVGAAWGLRRCSWIIHHSLGSRVKENILILFPCSACCQVQLCILASLLVVIIGTFVSRSPRRSRA